MTVAPALAQAALVRVGDVGIEEGDYDVSFDDVIFLGEQTPMPPVPPAPPVPVMPTAALVLLAILLAGAALAVRHSAHTRAQGVGH